MQDLKTLIERKDTGAIRRMLEANPSLANEGITIPFANNCHTAAHPLHRICDAVFSGNISDEEAVEIARVLLASGADINGDKQQGKGTPLLATASLHAEQLGIFYIENGADIHYEDENDGATALHWAAYCGLDQLVEKLVSCNAEIDRKDTSYDSTPLGWAIEPLLPGDSSNLPKRVNCIKLLLKAGADKDQLHANHRKFLDQLEKNNWVVE